MVELKPSEESTHPCLNALLPHSTLAKLPWMVTTVLDVSCRSDSMTTVCIFSFSGFIEGYFSMGWQCFLVGYPEAEGETGEMTDER